ncbi:hypothetical protein BH11PLA1_BH11PLA1_07790 [soil metagenome]
MISDSTHPQGTSHGPAALAACVLGIAGVAVLVALGGCVKPLLAPDEDRSPYDRYDAVRQQQAPQYIEDAYGRRLPNLRGRLLPKTE